MGLSFIKVFFDFEERTEALSEAERGRLMLAMLRYAQRREEPKLSGAERIIWPVFRGEIDRQMAAYNTRIENGNKGGRPRTETEENRNKPNETEKNRTETETNRNAQEQEQEQEKEQEKREERAREEARLVSGFGMFWLQYPRKEGKKNALKEWMRIRPGPELIQEILSGLEQQRKSDQWTRDGGQFIPHPATWLHGERWKDETVIPPARPSVTAQQYSQRDYSGEQEEAMMRMIAGMRDSS